MGDTSLVHEVKRAEELLHHHGCLILSESLLSAHLVQQVSSRYKLHNNVDVSLVLQELEDASDMWMIGFLKHLQLLLHQFLIHVVLFQLVLDDCLNSARDSSLPVGSYLHHSESSSSQLLAKFVVFTKLVDLLELGELLDG